MKPQTEVKKLPPALALVAIFSLCGAASVQATPEPHLRTGMFGVARGQLALINAVNVGNPDIRPIQVEMMFLDETGNIVGRDTKTVMPGHVDSGSRSILGFMLQADNQDDMTITLRLNGTKVWTWNYSEGKRVQFFQEVIAAGVVKPGKNVFSFESSSGDFRFLQLSDIIVWWQANN